MSHHNESIAAEVIAASIGGAFSASVLYPLEVLKTKLQAESKSKDTTSSDNNDPSQPLSATSYALQLYNSQGLTPFYSGITTSAFQSAVEKALYFFAYTGLKNGYFRLVHAGGNEEGKKPSMGTFVNLLLGCCAEWAHLPITLPIDCLTTKIQTTPSGSNLTSYAILCNMLSDPQQGLRGMYKGINAYVVLCLKPSIQYTVYERIKDVLITSRRNRGTHKKGRVGGDDVLAATEAFVLGMMARTIATIVCFPYLRAKVVLQSRSSSTTSSSSSRTNGDDENEENDDTNKEKGNGTSESSPPSPNPTTMGVSAMVQQMYIEGGFEEIFRGIGPELTRGVLSAALMMMVKEKIGVGVRTFLGVNHRR